MCLIEEYTICVARVAGTLAQLHEVVTVVHALAEWEALNNAQQSGTTTDPKDEVQAVSKPPDPKLTPWYMHI